jgi:hypothetical protein
MPPGSRRSPCSHTFRRCSWGCTRLRMSLPRSPQGRSRRRRRTPRRRSPQDRADTCPRPRPSSTRRCTGGRRRTRFRTPRPRKPARRDNRSPSRSRRRDRHRSTGTHPPRGCLCSRCRGRRPPSKPCPRGPMRSGRWMDRSILHCTGARRHTRSRTLPPCTPGPVHNPRSRSIHTSHRGNGAHPSWKRSRRSARRSGRTWRPQRHDRGCRCRSRTRLRRQHPIRLCCTSPRIARWRMSESGHRSPRRLRRRHRTPNRSRPAGRWCRRSTHPGTSAPRHTSRSIFWPRDRTPSRRDSLRSSCTRRRPRSCTGRRPEIGRNRRTDRWHRRPSPRGR